jgi:hypothetical protein
VRRISRSCKTLNAIRSVCTLHVCIKKFCKAGRERSNNTPVLNSKNVIWERLRMIGREVRNGVAMQDTESNVNCISLKSSDQGLASARKNLDACRANRRPWIWR